MNKKVSVLLFLSILTMMLVVGCSPNDPIPGSLYTKDIAPGTTGVGNYTVGELDNPYANGYFTNGYFSNITLSGINPIALEGEGKVWIEFRPDIDYRLVRAQGTPTWVQQGALGGFSLPIYNNDNEELFLDICIPDRWDGITSPQIHIDVFLDSTQDAANDAFRLQSSYNSYTPEIDIVPSGVNNLETEITTGVVPQFQSFKLVFIVPNGTMDGDDILGFRLRRIDVVTGNEIDGEVIISHIGVIFLCDKLGNFEPE